MNLFKRLFCKNKENGFKYVDLGLPSGTMWATCNVGATRPEDSGLLFQFGRVDGYKYGDKNNKFTTDDQITTSGKVYIKQMKYWIWLMMLHMYIWVANGGCQHMIN